MRNALTRWKAADPTPPEGGGAGHRPCGGPQAGMVLVAAMLILALLSVLAVAGISASSLEVKISAHDRDSKQAFYLCEAGLEMARYEIIKGWGTGSGGGTAPNWTFAFDTASMPAPVRNGGSIDWGAGGGKWVNFTLVDRRGVQYQIEANDGTYGITRCTGPAVAPQTGRASIFYSNSGVAFSGGNSTVTGNALTGIAVTWNTNSWTGHYLVDSASAAFDIVSNTVDTLTLSGNPASGPYQIRSALAVANTFTLAPGFPNATWNAAAFGSDLWYVRDSTSAMFRVTSAAGGSYGRIVLTLDGGTPQAGPFQLVTNPWLVGTTSPLTYTSTDFPVPSGADYGSATVGVTWSTATQGLARLNSVSASTATGAAKELALDVQLGGNGNVLLSNWRQLR